MTDAVTEVQAQSDNAVSVSSSAKESLSQVDRLSLDLAKQKRLTALAEAKAAVAANDTAEANYKLTVIQIYMKYKMTEEDGLSEDGVILRGAAATSQQQTK